MGKILFLLTGILMFIPDFMIRGIAMIFLGILIFNHVMQARRIKIFSF